MTFLYQLISVLLGFRSFASVLLLCCPFLVILSFSFVSLVFRFLCICAVFVHLCRFCAFLCFVLTLQHAPEMFSLYSNKYTPNLSELLLLLLLLLSLSLILDFLGLPSENPEMSQCSPPPVTFVLVFGVTAPPPPPPSVGQGLLIHEVSSHTRRRTTVGRTPLDE